MNDKTLIERLKAAGKYYCAYHDLFLLCREAATEIERMELLCQEAAEDIGRLEAEVKNWKETIKKYEDSYNALIVKNSRLQAELIGKTTLLDGKNIYLEGEVKRLQAELDNLALASHSDKRFSSYETIHINKDEVTRNDDLSVRDQFACAALNGVMINHPFDGCEDVAEQAYEIADAMLKVREKK